MAFPGRCAPGRDLVLERLPWHGPAPEGDRRHGRDRDPHGRRRRWHPQHPLVELERELADLHGKEAVLVFTSGYVSNETGISTIAKLLPNCVILSDAWNHNSMIEGVRRARARSKFKTCYSQRLPKAALGVTAHGALG
jgi:hypothetical protein